MRRLSLGTWNARPLTGPWIVLAFLSVLAACGGNAEGGSEARSEPNGTVSREEEHDASDGDGGRVELTAEQVANAGLAYGMVERRAAAGTRANDDLNAELAQEQGVRPALVSITQDGDAPVKNGARVDVRVRPKAGHQCTLASTRPCVSFTASQTRGQTLLGTSSKMLVVCSR